MSNGKNSGGVVIGIGIAALMVVSSTLGYKFITAVSPKVDETFNSTLKDTFGIEVTRDVKENPEEDGKGTDTSDVETGDDVAGEGPDSYQKIVSNKPYTYKSQNTRTYTGTTIHTTETYLYNSEGKVLDRFYNEDDLSLPISMNVDASEAIVLKDKTLYYIDADLNVKIIAEKVEGAGMCYEGGYFYYTTLSESYMRDVYIYDVAAGSATKVAETNLNNVAISPDGQTVAYFNYITEKELYTCKIGGEPKLVYSGLRTTPITVSNDGDTVYFESIDENDGIYCYNRGQSIKISKEYAYNAFFDRDCKQILFEEPGKVKYYKAGDTVALPLFDSSYMEYNVCNAKKQRTDMSLGHYIIDTDSFSDVLVIYDYENYFTLKGDTPVLFPIASSKDGMHAIAPTIGENGPVCYYEKDCILYRADYDGTYMVETAITEEGKFLYDKVVSDSGDEVWFKVYSDPAIYYCKKGQDPVKVADGLSDKLFNFKWNPQDGKCYYIKEGKLYSVYDSVDTIESYDIDIKEFGYPHYNEKVICIVDTSGKEFVLLSGELYPYN